MKFLARQKFRFDLGQSFMTLLNFGFVVLAASDKLASLVHLPAKVTVCVLVPMAVASVWTLGYFLDRAKFSHAYNAEVNQRNEMLGEVHRATKQ